MEIKKIYRFTIRVNYEELSAYFATKPTKTDIVFALKRMYPAPALAEIIRTAEETIRNGGGHVDKIELYDFTSECGINVRTPWRGDGPAKYTPGDDPEDEGD